MTCGFLSVKHRSPPVLHNFLLVHNLLPQCTLIFWRKLCNTGGGGHHRIRKSWNPYIFFQINALMDIKISILDICYANTARSLKLWCFLYFMNEKFNKNAKNEKLTKKVGRGARLIVIGPLAKSDLSASVF